MKITNSVLTAAVVAASLGLGLSAMARVNTSASAVPATPYAYQMSSQGQQRAQTFTGTVAKSKPGSFVLETGGHSYKLLGASQAAKYVGKQVKVVGVLDSKTNTIRVTSIGPAM